MAHLFFICFLFIRLISFSWVFWKLNKKKTNKRKTNERAIGKRAPTTKKKIMEVRYSWSLRATLDQSVQPKVDPEDTLTVALTDQPHFQYLFCVGFPFLFFGEGITCLLFLLSLGHEVVFWLATPTTRECSQRKKKRQVIHQRKGKTRWAIFYFIFRMVSFLFLHLISQRIKERN